MNIVKLLPKGCEIIFSSTGAKFYLKCPYNKEMVKECYSWLAIKKKFSWEGKYWTIDSEDYDDVRSILEDYF